MGKSPPSQQTVTQKTEIDPIQKSFLFGTPLPDDYRAAMEARNREVMGLPPLPEPDPFFSGQRMFSPQGGDYGGGGGNSIGAAVGGGGGGSFASSGFAAGLPGGVNTANPGSGFNEGVAGMSSPQGPPTGDVNPQSRPFAQGGIVGLPTGGMTPTQLPDLSDREQAYFMGLQALQGAAQPMQPQPAPPVLQEVRSIMQERMPQPQPAPPAPPVLQQLQQQPFMQKLRDARQEAGLTEGALNALQGRPTPLSADHPLMQEPFMQERLDVRPGAGFTGRALNALQGRMQQPTNFGQNRYADRFTQAALQQASPEQRAAAEDLLRAGSEQTNYRMGGYVEGPGTGRSDDIPATIYQDGVPVQDAALSDGEFVMTERAVRGAGNGNREEGAARMYEMMRRFENGGGVS